jgi:hypothetical protein
MKMTDITPEILPIENEKNVISVEATSTGV